MNSYMSRWGAGPLFAGLSVLYTVPVVALSRYFKPLFSLSFLPHRLLVAAGLLLISIGVTFLLTALISVHRAYNDGKLVTSGAYSICRHPVYSAWAVFIVPGIIFLYNSWLCLIVPVIMCITIIWLAQKEDKYLETKFGTAYITYKQKTPAVLPLGWITNKKRS